MFIIFWTFSRGTSIQERGLYAFCKMWQLIWRPLKGSANNDWCSIRVRFSQVRFSQVRLGLVRLLQLSVVPLNSFSCIAQGCNSFEMQQAGHSYFSAELVWKSFREFFMCIDNIQIRIQNHVGPIVHGGQGWCVLCYLLKI